MRSVRGKLECRLLAVLVYRPSCHASTAAAISQPSPPPLPRQTYSDGGNHIEEHLPSIPSSRSVGHTLPRTPRYNDLLRSRLRSTDPHHRAEALALLRDMLRPDSTHRPDSTTCSILVSALCKQNQAVDTAAIGLVIEMAKQGAFRADPVHFTQLVAKVCRSGGTGESWDLVHAVMEAGGTVETPVCNALLTGLAKDRDFSRMNLLFSEMKNKGSRPSVVTYGIIINHLSKSRRMDEALQLLDVMTQPESEVSPDVVTFNTIIDGLCKTGKLDDGLALLDRMRALDGCTPNAVTFNSLIDGLCKAGEIDAAHQLVARMENEGIAPNGITLNTLVSGMCRHGRISSALNFFHQNSLAWIDAKGNERTYSTLIGAFLHANNVSKAMELFDEMVQAGHSPDSVTYFALISGLSQVGRLDEACSVASSMRKDGFYPDIKCYNILISGFCKKQQLQKVCKVLEEMENAGLRPDVFTFNTLISASCKAGDFLTASQLMRRMIDEDCQPSEVTYGALIHGYCKAGKLSEALKIFHRMADSGVLPNTVIYNILIDSLCKQKEPSAAMSLINEMRDKGVPPNVTTYNAMFKGLQEKNMLVEAFELMDQMKEQGCDPNYVTMDILTEWLSAFGATDKLTSFVQKEVAA